MPCRGPDDGEIRAMRDHEARLELRERFDTATRLFCLVLTALENRAIDLNAEVKLTRAEAKEITTWWESHKAWDKQRRAILKRQAIEKLTAEEREALGLVNEEEDQ